MTATTNFKIGQKVTFIAVRRTGKTIKFTSRDGVVDELNGDVAVVRSKNGSLHNTPLSDLRAKGERNALTDAVLAGLGIEKDAAA